MERKRIIDQDVIDDIQEVVDRGLINRIQITELEFYMENNQKFLIGQGGFANVYKGKYKYFDVAIKEMKQFTGNEEEFKREIKSFIKEIEIHSKLKSERILNICGVCYSKNELFIITPFQEGGTLDDAIYRKQIFRSGTAEEIINKKLQFMIAIAEAITYLHCFNPPIVHRDIKPQNFLLDKLGGIKLIDFGISAISRSEEFNIIVTQQYVGTLAYMAPDCFSQNNKISINVDVWSFACVALEILKES